MRTWRRFAFAAAAAVTAAAPAVPASAAPATTTTSKPPASSGLIGSQGVPAGNTVVQSWALSPAVDTSQGGDRPNLSYELPPGAEVKDKVTLYNLSNVPLTFKIYATDALNTPDGGFDLLPGDKKPSDVGTWITLDQPSITLAPRTQATMPVTIKVPSAATPGDHAGGIVASSPTQSTGPDGKVVILDRRTGPRVYIRVAGPLSPRLAVEKLTTHYTPSLNPFGGKADVTYRIANRGNVRMGGSQQVSFAGPLGLAGKHKPSVALPEILPGQTVLMHTTFTGALSSLLATGSVMLKPAPVGAASGTKSSSWRSLTLAPPYTVLALALSCWLLVRARRAYVKRNRDVREPSYAV